MSNLFDTIQTLYQGNTEISIAILVAIIVVLIVIPKAAGKLLGAIAVIFVVGYLIVTLADITGSTMDKKSDAAHKTDREFQKQEK